MALIRRITCQSCGKTKDVSVTSNSYPNICNACEDVEKEIKRDSWLAERSRDSIEGRIEFIERWIYDHKQVHRGISKPLIFG
jgi:hypothetical protein